MSGISSLGSSSLPNGGLSAVGASLLSSGQAPNPAPSPATSSTSSTADTYQKQYAAFEQYNEQELLYASFLSPQDGLANADSVLEQAAQLLGTPGNPGTYGQTQSTSTGSSPAASTGTGSSGSSSTSTASNALTNVPSVASILAASDSAAQQTLNAYANAPVGSSILDFQA
jgi:hypothetical protein